MHQVKITGTQIGGQVAKVGKRQKDRLPPRGQANTVLLRQGVSWASERG